MGFMDKLSWKEYFLIGGLLIIWSLAIYAGLIALSRQDAVTAGLTLFIGIIFTGVLLIIIAIIDRIF